ncbi:MAG: hypothetical protein ACR2M9_03365 [Cyanophyceae cyanobacterium]
MGCNKLDKPLKRETMKALGKCLPGTSFEKMGKETKKKDLEKIFQKSKPKKK